jgi:hypothetical protein
VIRLRLFLERVGWKRLLAVTLGIVALAAAGTVFAVTRGGDESADTPSEPVDPGTNLYYLQAVAPKVQATGCTMNIRFIWKPNYHADQYIGATAVIIATGAGIEGAYRKPFTAKGVSLDVGPVSLAGGYTIWSARIESIDGDPPGNNTTIQAAPPPTSKCE